MGDSWLTGTGSHVTPNARSERQRVARSPTPNTQNSTPHDDGCQWSRMSVPTESQVAKRSKHTMVLFKNSLYVFGGDDGSKRMLNDLLKYDIEAGKWVSLSSSGRQASVPSPRYHHSSAVYRNSMFVFGGYSTGPPNVGFNETTYGGLGPGERGIAGGIALATNSSRDPTSGVSGSNLQNRNDLYEYRFLDNSWHEWHFDNAGSPTPRSAHCSFVYNKRLWIFAGYGDNGLPNEQRRLQTLNDMWNVSLENNSFPKHWEQVEQQGMLPPPCCNFSVTVVGNRLFLFSGVSGKEMTNHLFTFDFDNAHWTRISPEHILHGSSSPPCKRYGHTMVEYQRRLYVFGGSAGDSLATDLICFDLDHKSWEKVVPRSSSSIITGRLFHAAVVYNDHMYIFGGTVETDRRSNELFAFKFPTYPKCTLTEDLLRLLTDERLLTLADVEFVFPDGDSLPAHAVVVAARCPALREAIRSERTHQAEKSRPRILIEEANKKAFHLVLQYLYTDRIRPDFSSANSNDDLLLQIIKVCKLATVFSLARLECLCLRFLEEAVTIDNILRVLSEAHQLQLLALKEFCVKRVIREDNFLAVIKKPQFNDLPSTIIVELIRRNKQVQPSPAPASPLSPGGSLDSNDLQTESTLVCDLQRLLNDSESREEFSDVQLLVGDVPVPAHKAILAARSQYFRAHFNFHHNSGQQPLEAERSEPPVRMMIDDLNPSVQAVNALLRYIYCGVTEMPPEDSLFLVKTPSYYGFTNDRLAHVCQRNLETNITCSTVLRVFMTVDSIPQFSNFREACLQFIVRNYCQLAHCADRQLLSAHQHCHIWDALAANLDAAAAAAAATQYPAVNP